MKRNLRIVIPAIVLLLIIYSCSKTGSVRSCATWVGEYMYNEDPVPTATGINRIMQWELSVSQQRDTCWGVLEVTGLRTYMKLLTFLSGDSNKVNVVYNKYLDGTQEFREGDVLFSFKRDSNKLITTWVTLQPQLTDYPAEEGTCFSLKKRRKSHDL